MDEESVAEAEANEPVEPSEPVILKKRGRPKGSLNKKTIAKMRDAVLPDIPPEPLEELPPMVLDVDFTSDEILGDTIIPKSVKRKPKAAPRVRDPPTEPPSEEDSPPPTPTKRKRPPRVKTLPRESDKYREDPMPETVNPPSYLEILTRGLKEAKAKQYAEKVAQCDQFFQW